MSLNTAGFLLEGFRVATANSPFTFPPRTLVSNQGVLDATTQRAEYALFVSGQDPNLPGIEIADPNLRILWTRNNGTAVRFDWDGFAKRWNTSPGAGQETIGKLANSPRLAAPVPDTTLSSAESPYALYSGSPDRVAVFTPSVVGSSADFTDPPPGTVQISSDKGEVNFGTADLANPVIAGQPVYIARQGFFDRTKVKGRIGTLPDSAAATYGLWLNPIPGAGQTPRVRIGFRGYLTAVPVASESQLVPLPAPGFFKIALSTGKLAFASADITAYAGMPVYYDGVLLGSFQFSRGTVGPPGATWPAPVASRPEFVGVTDATRFVIFSEPANLPRYYYVVQVADSDTVSSGPPSDGTVYIDPSNGSLYVSGSDPGAQTGAIIQFLDSVHEVEGGVSVQFFRSGLNSSGEEQTADFVNSYAVLAQVVADGIGSSPFVQLPTVPTIDSFIEYKVDQGTSGGTYTGGLVDANDPTKPGNGYILDLELRQLKFSQRKTVAKVLDKATSALKLDDAVINPFGFEVTRNAHSIRPGIDFDFNQDVGLLEFIEPVGENDPGNSLGFSGTVTLPNRFDASPGSFPVTAQNGKFLFVKTGPNFGIYPILASSGTTAVFISGTFKQSGPATADIRATREIIADRFWTPFIPPFKKLKVYRAASVAGPFGLLATSEFSILASTGQVNLNVAAKPGEVFKVEYTSLDSPDEGVTVTSTPRTEFAGFKIRQETGVVVPNSGVIHFNSDGKTVLTAYPITIYVDGITVPPEGYVFTAPGTLTVSTLLTDTTMVTINYFVAESPGGNTFFALVNTPVDVDFPLVTSGESVTKYNGDQRALVSPGSAILIDDKELVLVGGVSYDQATDTTEVTFNPEPTTDSAGAGLKVCGPVTGTYIVTETSAVDVLTKGTNNLSVFGNIPYPSGTIVLVDNDPYYVVSSNYVPANNRTSVVLAVNAHRNYILPDLKKTIRPVFFPGAEFKTQKPVHAGYPLTLVRTGTVNKTLKSGVDYDSGEGGVIKMTSTLVFGDTVTAFYVARKEQPVGTSFTFNYAFQIAPNQTNGIRGQKLVAKYHLNNPDTFFFRVESVKSFIPEVIKELASSSGGSSGPSTSSSSSLQTKDYGSASLYFDEQHLRNLDIVVARLLKFYNDQANYYEDMLADFDGRVVGGSSGRFRFNGDVSGVRRNSYAEVQNDIDDQVKLYDGVVLVSFGPPLQFADGPVFGPIWDYNALSRFYGTARSSVPVAFNDKVLPIVNFGSTIGSIGIGNLTSVGSITTARSRSAYSSTDKSKKVLALVGPNGDAKTLVPPFYSGQKVKFYGPDGVEQGSATVSNVGVVDPLAPVPLGQITLDTAVTSPFGAIMADTSDAGSPGVHTYTEGSNVSIDYDSGQVHNSQLPPPFGPLSVMAGNELVETSVTFVNKDVTPKRIPSLDGLLTNDAGLVSFPPLTYANELNLLARELFADGLVGTGVISGIQTVTSCFIPVAIGDTVRVLAGINAGQSRTVLTVTPPSTFTVSPSFGGLDPFPRSMYVVSAVGDIPDLVSGEIGAVSTNVATAPSGTATIGVLDSQLLALEKAILSYGPNLVNRTSGSATAADVFSDPGAGFLTMSPAVNNSCFLYLPGGPNRGLYKVKEVTSGTLKLDTAAPFHALPAPGTSGETYVVVQPWSFVTPKQPAFATEFIRTALDWIQSCASWAGGISSAGYPARVAAINARVAAIGVYASRLQSLLKKDEKIYDTRYLWIKQRIDRKEGLVVKIGQAASKRVEAQDKLISDQQKKLIAQQISQ